MYVYVYMKKGRGWDMQMLYGQCVYGRVYVCMIDCEITYPISKTRYVYIPTVLC